MNPDERTEAEGRAERALRRGDLAGALALYQAIFSAFPNDGALASKLERIREMLQPMELQNAKARVANEPARAAPAGAIENAEAFAAQGDYPQAIALYRRALAEKPDSELLQERLAELFQIATAMAPPRTTPPAPAPPRVLSDLLDQIGRRRRGGSDKD